MMWKNVRKKSMKFAGLLAYKEGWYNKDNKG